MQSNSPRRHETITSRSNPWFRRFREALDQHDREIVIEGRKQIADAIAAGWKPIAVASLKDADAPENALMFAAPLIRALTDTEMSQGVVALFERREFTIESIVRDATSVILSLDGVQDPGNVGTIVRLAAAFDAAGVVLLEGCADPFSQKAIRASVGAVLDVPVARGTRKGLLDLSASERIPLFAAVRSPAPVPLPEGRSILVLGSEGRGVSREIVERASPVSIPMSDRVESLNVAAAAAILLAEQYGRRPGSP